MKKTIITILALCGVAAAAPSLTTDFTTAPTDWTSGQWNGWNTPHFNYGENGAVIAQPWKQNTLSTAITLSPEEAITIEFSTFGNGNEQGLMFYLSSSTDNYSVVTGTSYNSNKAVDVGYLDKAIVPRTEDGGSNMGNVGVKSISIIPEPTTATLSLLALAGLAARRRRASR